MVRTWLPAAHLALSLVVLMWDIVLAGRIAQLRAAPRPLAAMSGLASLLLLPAVIVALATSTVVTGRAIQLIDWLWPAILVLFAAQALYALVNGYVNPLWGIPIAVYDLILAVAGVVRYLVARGAAMPAPLVLTMATESGALALMTTPAALYVPFYLLVPMIAPAFPALRRITASFRAFLALVALGWVVLIATRIPPTIESLRSYEEHAGDRLTERPAGDFAIGLKIFPDLRSPPPPPSIVPDLTLADTIEADVVSVVIVPDASPAALDSLAHVMEGLQRDSTLFIVSLGYRGKLVPELSHAPLDARQRLDMIRRVVRRLHPDILLPAEDPYGVGARLLGSLPVATWEDYLTRAASVAKSADRRVRIGVSASAFDSRDSTLYAWAAGPGSPIDVVGFSFFPNRLGAREIDAAMRAADRWMRVMPPAKEHWVFATGGYPLAHGEASQTDAVWATLAWATAHQSVKGAVVYEAGDYGQSRGLRAPDGRLRPLTYALIRAQRGLRETAAP